MQFHKLIEQRRSIREFKDMDIENQDILSLKEYTSNVEQLESDISSSFHFIENGGWAYEAMVGYAGYFGMPIEAPHYILLISENKEHYKKNAGYLMEQVLLQAYDMEIGTCWIDVLEEKQQDLKERLNINLKGEIVAISALGYPKTNIFGIEKSYTDRQSIKELVYKNKWGQLMDLEEVNQRGLEEIFFYSRYAPSWGNTQPWKFIVAECRLILTMLQDEEGEDFKDHELECGIMMLYIEKMMHKQGIKGNWEFNINNLNKEKFEIPKNHEIKGWFPI